jgi:hypothetical protein
MQNRAIRLMASKLAVAGIIEGNLSEEGLAAMSDCADMTTALARELTQGIKDEVEDLSSVFKKMAILKPAAEIIEHTADADSIEEPVTDDEIPIFASINADEEIPIFEPDVIDISAHSTAEDDEITSGLLLITYRNSKHAKSSKKKTVVACDNQISLFDLIGKATG